VLLLALDPARTHETQIAVAVESEEIHQQVALASQVESTDVRTEQAQTRDKFG